MDFQEDMCEFIIISPGDALDIEKNDIDLDSQNKKFDQKLNSPRKCHSNSPAKQNTENFTMSLPKEFLISDNPFKKSFASLESPTGKLIYSSNNYINNNESIDKFKSINDEEIKHESSEEIDSGSEDEHSFKSNNNNKYMKKEIIKKESESEDSEENEDILIKYKINFPYSKAKNLEIWNIVKNFTPISSKDDIRCENSHKSGGQICADPQTVKNIRSIGKELIKEIGRKIISGSFNLTTISFPIKAMIPKSALENIFQGSNIFKCFLFIYILFFLACFFPIYVNRACMIKDPLERLKLVITSSIASFYLTNSFGKPVFFIIVILLIFWKA